WHLTSTNTAAHLWLQASSPIICCIWQVHLFCLLHYYEMTGFVRVPVNVSRIFPDEPHKPPASKAALDSLKTAPIEGEGKKCPVCLKDYSPGETVTEIACCHAFHKDCIIPWLTRVSC
ncbi:unnamed protein product, partial [Ixodes pacificus]